MPYALDRPALQDNHYAKPKFDTTSVSMLYYRYSSEPNVTGLRIKEMNKSFGYLNKNEERDLFFNLAHPSKCVQLFMGFHINEKN